MGPAVLPAPCTVCTGLYPGVKRPESGVEHPSTFCDEFYKRVELYEGWNFNSGNYLFTTDTK